MHGLVNCSLQKFLTDTYGRPCWEEITRAGETGITDFESMLQYDNGLTDRIIRGAEIVLRKPRAILLEDLGTYLVSHPNVENLRRLLRFGGSDFLEFLYSLEDLPGRARLALPDLHLPQMAVEDISANAFLLHVDEGLAGFAQVIAGMLRAIADDYGALVVLEPSVQTQRRDSLKVLLIESEYAQGRRFELGAMP